MYEETSAAVCVLFDASMRVSKQHVIHIDRILKDGKECGVRFYGIINGLKKGLHGFHVHESGDLTDGCKSLCAHFNPYHQYHGGLRSQVRHLGDLGNIIADSSGTAVIDIRDPTLRIHGRHGILGRSLVIHADEDDLGMGSSPLSKTTGNSGNRILCGVIGYARGCSS